MDAHDAAQCAARSGMTGRERQSMLLGYPSRAALSLTPLIP